MTVSYQYKVASSTSGGFTRLLFMWRGSLYKLIYRELLIFLLAFDVLSVFYRNLFTDEQKKIFEKLVTYCDTFISLIPLTFILGFYVAYVAARWWQQYEAIPWPDKAMHTIALYFPENDEKTRIIRRTLMRYLNLTLVLILRSISSAVKKRFPSIDHLTDVGFMTPTEKQVFLSVPNNEFNTYWIPCAWFIHVLRDARAEYPDMDSLGLKLIMEEFNEFRSKCGLLWSYDWISIPLVYTQVVTLATYSFFVAAVIGRQYVEHSDKKMQMEIDIYLPVFTLLQFLFFMGLLKVAEQLINPFGDDDEDFELNWLIDRHMKVSYLGVDTLMLQRLPLQKDKYFDDDDLVLPYTEAAAIYKKKTFRGSVHYMQVPKEQQDMYLPEIIEEDNESQKVALKARRPSLFAKIFQGKAPQVDDTISEKEDVSINGSWRPTSANLESDLNALRKMWGVDGMSIANNQQRKSGQHSPDGRLSSVGGEQSARKKVTKHNSMMYSIGRRNTKSKKDFNERRRKSVPAVVLMQRDSVAGTGTGTGTLSRNSSKWSLRKDSLVDSQRRGIRWKPFVANSESCCDRDDERTPNSEDAAARIGLDANLRDEVVYVNEGFVASMPEENLNSRPAQAAATNNNVGPGLGVGLLLSPHHSPYPNGSATSK